jgi:hypothetical protein
MRQPRRILRDLPKLDTISPNTPLRLDVAATLAFPDGSMTVSGLRRERDRGRLEIERIAGKDYTTLASIERMRELCRVPLKESGSGFVPRNETLTAHSANEPCGLFETDRAKSARAALHRIARAPSGRSASTLPTSINPTVPAGATLPNVKNGKRKEHPFGEDNGDAAAMYLAKHIYSIIEAVVERPAAAMEFLQDLTAAAADDGLSLQWVTPTGFPRINRYYKQETKQVRLFLHRLGVFRVLLTTGKEGVEPKINRRKAKNGVAPNCVHACDAAQLMRTVNAAVAEGINSIATVHDSFGCLPSRAERFRKIILEEFVRMYEEHDVLGEVLNQARADLSSSTKRMPSAPPQYGLLDLKQVLSAEFAFA